MFRHAADDAQAVVHGRTHAGHGGLEARQVLCERLEPQPHIVPELATALGEEHLPGQTAQRRAHHGPEHHHGAIAIDTTLPGRASPE